MKELIDLFRQETFTREDMRLILETCRERKSLAPLMASAYLKIQPLTEKEIEFGKRLWDEIYSNAQKGEQ